jgi:DUF3102 family protein
MSSIATVKKHTTAVARPLKVLVPLIKEELTEGDAAGLEHFRRAGAMLVEAKDQVAHGSWSSWLSKNFELSQNTAIRYMRLARMEAEQPADSKFTHAGEYRGLRHAIGEPRAREAWRNVFKAADKVNVNQVKQERQSREEEIEIRRKLALELIGLGYKALATRLHPDRGGSRDAMARLNDIRDELTEIAATRRFV